MSSRSSCHLILRLIDEIISPARKLVYAAGVSMCGVLRARSYWEDSLRVTHALPNQIHPNIKVDLRLCDTVLNFFDVQVLLSISGFIKTQLFSMPTDARSYLHYTSYHPPATKRAIPKGLGMRIKRIWSSEKDLGYHRH